MTDTPRLRRLRADRRALEQLKADSTIFDFVAPREVSDSYALVFNGRGVWRPDVGSSVRFCERHEVYLRLGAAYPRMMPELTWRSPIFHPNISSSGVVCLGGYGTYWAPSLSLDELCTMLWDMIRYQNFDPNSPYNRDAAIWVKNQKEYAFPLDPRPIRDRVAQKKREPAPLPKKPAHARPTVVAEPDIVFVEPEVVDAELLDDTPGEEEILFID